MSLENDIQQSKFRNEYQKAMINIIYTHNYISERNKKIFERGDITGQQYNILRILRGAGKALSTLQIRQRMLDKMSDTSRIVDRLVKKDLVQKVVCEGDRRLVDVTITEKGRLLLETMENFTDEMDAMMGKITPDEAQTLNNLLDKIRGSQ